MAMNVRFDDDQTQTTEGGREAPSGAALGAHVVADWIGQVTCGERPADDAARDDPGPSPRTTPGRPGPEPKDDPGTTPARDAERP